MLPRLAASYYADHMLVGELNLPVLESICLFFSKNRVLGTYANSPKVICIFFYISPKNG